jgi:hypothetical protein
MVRFLELWGLFVVPAGHDITTEAVISCSAGTTNSEHLYQSQTCLSVKLINNIKNSDRFTPQDFILNEDQSILTCPSFQLHDLFTDDSLEGPIL